MKYQIEINKTEKANTSNFKAIENFLKSFDANHINFTYNEDGKEYNVVLSGINCMSEFKELKTNRRLGR